MKVGQPKPLPIRVALNAPGKRVFGTIQDSTGGAVVQYIMQPEDYYELKKVFAIECPRCGSEVIPDADNYPKGSCDDCGWEND